MYKKIWGLKQLEKMGFPCPPYVVIDITGDAPTDVKEYIQRKIREVGIPQLKGESIGVTIRVSLRGTMDKLAKHGGLHVTDEEEILRRVLEKYQQYKPDGKIVVQHTIDAKCSGTILKENDIAIIEAILGDAPPLLEGHVTNYERWIYVLRMRRWRRERSYECNSEKVAILTSKELQAFEKYVEPLLNHTYLEWSISKSGKLYFYEYYKLKNEKQ